MNNSGQVNVELKLLLDSLKRQAKEAATILREAFKVGATDMSPSIDKATKKQSELTREVRRTTDQLKEQKKAAMEAWRASLPKPVISIAGSGSYGKAGPGAYVGPVYGSGLASGGMKPPTPPVAPRPAGGIGGLPPGFYPLVPGGGGGGGGAGGGGAAPIQQTRLMVAAQLGAVMAGLRSTLGLVQFAFQKLLEPMRAMLAVADSARRLYARGVLSGTGVGYSAQMGTLANIIGVSEDQVMQFGRAMQYLGDRVKFSTGILAKNNPVMTELGWTIKTMQSSFAALASEISATFAPILKKLAEDAAAGADKMTVAWSNFIRNQRAMSFAENSGLDIVRDPSNSKAPFLGFKRAGDDDTQMIGGALGEKIGKEFEKYLERWGASQAAQGGGVSANRLAASAWEKMGLVLGSGGQNHAEATARNTARMAGMMQTMVGLLSVGKGGPEENYNYSRP